MVSQSKPMIVLVCLALVLTGCQAFQPSPTAFPAAQYTEAAQTMIVQLTQSAPTATMIPTALPATSTQQPTQPPPTNTVPAPIPATNTPVPTATLAPANTQAPTNTQAPPPAPAQAFNLVFQDDFSSKMGWFTQQADNFSLEFAQGGYRITVNFPNGAVVSVKERDYGDVSLEVDGVQVAGPSNSYYGLTCRMANLDNYYALVISSDSSFGIAKMEKSKLTFLQEQTAPPGVIQPMGSVNHIRADCIGNVLTLYANGTLLTSVQDGTFQSGSIGMVAGNRNQTGVEVIFSNFKAYLP